MTLKKKLMIGTGICLLLGILSSCGSDPASTTNTDTSKSIEHDDETDITEATTPETTENTFDPYQDGVFSTFTDQEYQVDRDMVLSDLHQNGKGYDTVWLKNQEVYGGYNSVEEEEIQVGEPGTHDKINFIGTILGINNSCYISYESTVSYTLWQDGWKTTREDFSGLYTYDFSQLNGTYWKTSTGNMTQTIGMRLFGDDIFDGKEIPTDATLYIALDRFDSLFPIDSFNFGGSGKMADAVMVSDGQIIASREFDFTGNKDIFVTAYDAKEAYVSCHFISFSLMGEDMAWDFILDTDSITQINAEEYEKATQNGSSTTAESITTVNPDAEDLVYGTYEYKNGIDAFSAEVGYSSGDDCDYIGITHYSNNGTATIEFLNLSQNADGSYTGEGTEYATSATILFSGNTMQISIDSTDEPTCEKMAGTYTLTEKLDFSDVG